MTKHDIRHEDFKNGRYQLTKRTHLLLKKSFAAQTEERNYAKYILRELEKDEKELKGNW